MNSLSISLLCRSSGFLRQTGAELKIEGRRQLKTINLSERWVKMNRTAAILLLPIMVIFAMQPVIALHYCGGKLKSLGLFTRQTATAINPVNTAGGGENHSCCKPRTAGDSRTAEDPPGAGTARHGYALFITGDQCCNTEILKLTTDDYQSKITQQASRLLSFFIGNAEAIPARLFKLPEPGTDIRTPLHYFPPGGFFLKDVSILTYICIYRI